jgi:alpha,alpha-trehalase
MSTNQQVSKRCPKLTHVAAQRVVTTTRPLEDLHSTVHLSSGERISFVLGWNESRVQSTDNIEQVFKDTENAWHRWIQRFHYEGPQAHLARRSAITLKLLDHFRNGSIVAAATSSLPECRRAPNWDHR